MAEAKKQNYLKGAAILAATVAITKVIGFIYKIPLYNLLGDEGTAHFQVTYTIYNLLLTISTAGVPVALSRLISAARAMDRPMQARRYYNVGMAVFGLMGILGTLVMLFFAQPMADFMGDSQVSLAVRFLSPAVFFACLVSVLRGYSQGYNDMLPTAISQIMEVLCKLIFGLAIAWYFAKLGKDSPTVAAGAIVGVTIGLGVSVPIMMIYKKGIARRNPDGAVLDRPKSYGETLWEIVRVGVPITIGSSIMNIITLIDTKLVLERLQVGAGFSYDDAVVMYGVYSKGLTLFNLPSAFITPIAVSVVPVISAAIARKLRGELKGTVESCMKLTNLIAMPAGVGLAVLAQPIFTVLYPNSNEKGPMLLSMLGIASYFVCTYIITNSVLQASGHEKLSLMALPVGGIVKIGVNVVLVGMSGVNIAGAPIGTISCYVCITLINLYFIGKKLSERPNLVKITLRPLICAALMGVGAYGTYGLLHKFLFSAMGGGRIGAVFCLGGAIGVGVVVYGVLIIALGAITREDMLLLPKGEKLARILRIK